MGFALVACTIWWSICLLNWTWLFCKYNDTMNGRYVLCKVKLEPDD